MKADLAAGIALTLLGLAMALGDGAGAQAALVPLATLPVAWRRVAPDRAALVQAAGILATAGLPRCGAVIPAALLTLYALGDRVVTPAVLLAALGVLTVSDPIIDAAALEFVLPVGVGVWGAGRLVRSRERVAGALAARSDELQRERRRTAELAVAVERTRLAGALDATARDRTRAMLELAERGGPEAFGGIEQLGRESLHDMRELLGTLRPDPEPASPCGHERDPSASPTSPTQRIAPALALAAAVAVVFAPDVPYPDAGLVVLAALAYACGAHARAVPGALATASLFAAAAGSSPVPVLICALGPWLAGRVVRSRERLVAQVRERSRELEAEQVAQSQLAIRHEHARIARELHDVVAHHLAVMVVQAGAGRLRERADPERLAQIACTGRQALADMERLVELIGEDEHDVDLLLERARAAGLTIHAPALELDATGYRVVREAVTNVIKHAPGSEVEVRAERGEIEVRDSGPASPPTLDGTGAGLGLDGLRERVTAAGGSLDAGPHPDGGWSVRARLPQRR